MRIAIKWGVILAIAIALWTLLIHLLGFYTDRIQYAATADQVVLILPLTFLTLALLEQRRLLDGRLPFGRGILTGLTVAAVSAPLTVGFLWYYHHYINPDWLAILVAYKQQSLAVAGVAPDQIATQVAQLQQGGTDRAQLVGGLIGTVVMGVVVSAVIWVVLTTLARSRAVPLVLATLAVAVPRSAIAQTCGTHCGTERWAVKSFTDADTGQVDLTPRTGSVAELRAFPRPATVAEARRSPLELRTYRLRVLLIGWKHESDDDYHVVVADSAHPAATMIVEIPSRNCARVCSSPLLARMTAARQSIEGTLGPVGAHYHRLASPVMVTVTGILFFDKLHGQTGVAPNGIELHPVIGLAFGAEPAAPSPAPAPMDSLLTELVGDWSMVGNVHGHPVTYTLTGTRVLQGKFVELHMTDVHQPPRYEARVYIGVDSADQGYIAHWLDNSGASFSIPPATGTAVGDTIRLAFAYADGPFRDTFIYHRHTKGWTFHLEDTDSSGTWRPFADYEVHPAPHP